MVTRRDHIQNGNSSATWGRHHHSLICWISTKIGRSLQECHHTVYLIQLWNTDLVGIEDREKR
jgi:hypothetical protein